MSDSPNLAFFLQIPDLIPRYGENFVLVPVRNARNIKMGLTSLNAALSGLKVYQQQIDVISNNVANVGTEGYTRKILPQSTQVVDGRSIGVLGETIMRNVDFRVQKDLWTQVSSVNFSSVQATYLERVDQFHGAPSDNVSVAAEISKLQDVFSALANAPDDQFLLADVVDQAEDTANKINDLANYLTTLRNDAQAEADIVVQTINDLLEHIASLNSDIRFTGATGGSTAVTEDKRDQAVKELSGLIGITTFKRGDGVLVVQTMQGVEMASDVAIPLYFKPTPLSAQTYYPDTAAGIYSGDPTKNANAINITEREIGGKLGGLMDLRDYSFPKQIAQLDELAHKMALRFDAQGLRLFNDTSGSIPADTPPDTSTDPVTPVQYVGFASQIRVNAAVLADNSLVQKGTYGGDIKTGESSLVRRIVQNTFGDVNYQLAANSDTATSVDIRAAATGGTTLQDWLGLHSQNTLKSGVSLSNYASISDMIATGGTGVFGTVLSKNDSFIIRLDDPDFGGGPYDIEVDLRAVAVSGFGAAQDLVDYITADADWAAAVADFGVSASVSSTGQLVLNSRSNIEIVNDPVSPMVSTGFSFLGINTGLIEAEDPYFEVKVGNQSPVKIAIEPSDTEVELLAKLNAVDGLAAQIDANGFLSLRPGNDFNNPDFGGDIQLNGAAFATSGATLGGTALGRTSIDDGINIAYALFGTYQDLGGGIFEGYSPINDVQYGSETENGSGVFLPFRETLLGTGANVRTEINQTLTLKDYGQKLVNETAQELALIQSRLEDEETLQSLLEQRFLDESSVNIDEELGFLIVVQTAYAASARVINAVDELFKELLNVV